MLKKLLFVMLVMPVSISYAQDVRYIEAPRAATADELIHANQYENRTPGVAASEGFLKGIKQAQDSALDRQLQMNQIELQRNELELQRMEIDSKRKLETVSTIEPEPSQLGRVRCLEIKDNREELKNIVDSGKTMWFYDQCRQYF